VPITGGLARRDRYRQQVDSAVVAFSIQWTAEHHRIAKRVCYRTIWTECDWNNYANKSVAGSIDCVPNDGYPIHGGDLDSVGLYQQRSRWWGDTPGSMDPFVATHRFLERMLVNAPDWLTLDESTICQRVQQSQFDGVTIDKRTGKPYPYAQNYRDRDAQTDALEADLVFFSHLERLVP
jgi:hypothetical protein